MEYKHRSGSGSGGGGGNGGTEREELQKRSDMPTGVSQLTTGAMFPRLRFSVQYEEIV